MKFIFNCIAYISFVISLASTAKPNDPCTSDKHCGVGLECVAGACGTACMADAECEGEDQICLYHQCATKCSSNSQCATHQLCVESICSITCQDSRGCPCSGVRNSICFFNLCHRRCTADEDCTPNFCMEGVCRDSQLCTADSDCHDNNVCHLNDCKKKCDTQLCPGTHECKDEVCDTNLFGSCKEESCPCGQACIDGNCTAQERIGLSCTDYCGFNAVCSDQPSGVCQCIRDQDGHCQSLPDTCTTKANPCNYVFPGSLCNGAFCDCKDFGSKVSERCYDILGVCHKKGKPCQANTQCRNAHCYQACNSDADCSTDMECYEEVCTRSCWRDENCDANQVCVNGHCLQTCQEETGCDKDRQVCDAHRCRTSCTDDNSCGDDSHCIKSIGCATSCAKDVHCLPGLEICVSGICTQTCTESSDCAESSSCINGRCYIQCESADDCSSSQTCHVGLCMLTCQESSECGSRETCFSKTCRLMCLSNEDCNNPPQICFAGLCSFQCELEGIGDRNCERGDDCILRDGVEGCVPTCSLGCNEAQYCEDSLCWKIYKLACIIQRNCAPHFYCKKELGASEGICEPKVLVGSKCPDGNCGFNEICADGICQCIRNSEGDCLGPYNYCPAYTSTPGRCNNEIVGSLCNEETHTCECPTGQVEIARICINTTICTKDDECIGGSCISFHCYPHCGPNTPCQNDFTCINGLCSLSCYGHANCDFNQQCVQGACVTLCRYGSSEPCGTEQVCDTETGICRIQCETNNACTNTTTFKDSYCKNSFCVPNCESFLDCDAHSICDESSESCFRLCTSDNECTGREHCVAGLCTPTCTPATACPPKHTCVLGLCSLACSDHSDCERPGGRCHEGQCVYICVTQVTGNCGGAACAAGLCTAHCNVDEQCGGASYKCDLDSGGCYLPCTTEEQCTTRQMCASGGLCQTVVDQQCVANDAATSICGDEDVACHSSQCVPIHTPGKICDSTANCSLGEYCNGLAQCECVKRPNGECLELTACTTEAECDKLDRLAVCDFDRKACACQPGSRLSPTGCVSDLHSCSDKSSCKSGEDCYDFTCHTVCTTDPERDEDIYGTDEDVCPLDTKCRNGFCLQTCYSDVGCPSASQSCLGGQNDGVCVSMCSRTLMSSTPCVEGITTARCGPLLKCSKNWLCEDGFCIHACVSNAACAKNQKCIKNECRCNHAEYQCPGPTKASGNTVLCASNRDCGEREECLFSTCQCQLGGIRSFVGVCVWNVDTVCHSCPACVGSCYKPNMVCNKLSRLCVCAEGFKLDRTGLACTEVSGAATNIPCRYPVDCASYPSTTCSQALGRCVCNPGLCHTDGTCAPDTNECLKPNASNCMDDTRCINSLCREEPECTVAVFATGIPTFGVNDPDFSCETSSDCYKYSAETCFYRKCGTAFCYHRKCTCERGAVVVSGTEQERLHCIIIKCTKNDECLGWALCSASGICRPYGDLTLPPTAPIEQIDVANEAFIAIGSLIGLLLLLLVVFLAYKKFAPTKAEKQKRYWEAEEARLAAEEAELDQMEREFEEEQQQRKDEYLRMLREKREQQAKEARERAELERLKREEEERLLREQMERQEAERLRRLQEEKEAKEREKKLKKEARMRAIAERKAKAAAEKKRLAEEAAAERARIEAERLKREAEEAARIKAEKEAEEKLKREQEEKERRLREEQEAKRLALKKQQEAARKAREKAQRDKIEAIKRAHQLEQERIAEEKRKASQALLNRAPVDEDEDELGESGWSSIPRTVSRVGSKN